MKEDVFLFKKGSTQTRRTLYLSIVRCHLGYATQVWSPQSIGLLKRVENVQRRATKLILKLPFQCDVTYKTRLQLTNLLPISYWHEYLDMAFFYKAVNNTWNVLPAELRTSHISLALFKILLLQYDADDIRTWRTICPRCNTARSLLCPPTCCF